MPSEEELFLEGLELFNKGEFFECHEAWESAWNQEPEPGRQFTQGLIQIAVGIHHLQRGNRVGALKLLPRGLQRISAFQPEHRGVDVATLCRQVQSLHEAVEAPMQPTSAFVIPQIFHRCED